MKILVTGGAGFIGSNLVEELIKKYKVVVIDNFNNTYSPKVKRNNIKNVIKHKNYKLYEIDLREKDSIEKVFKKEKKFDYVFHIAGIGGVRQSQTNPNFYYEENLIATINLVEVMKDYNCKNLIYFSSSSVYGNTNKEIFNEEDNSNSPISIYAATKRASEIMLYNYYINYNFKIVILRPFTVYGPKQRPDLAIYLFTKKIINEEEITVYGNGSMIRDYTYISDIVNATLKTINFINSKKDIYEIFNIASSNPKSINEVVKIIEKVTKKQATIKYKEKPIGDVNKTYGNITKANKLLKWQPKTDFEEGITKFIEWYIKNEK